MILPILTAVGAAMAMPAAATPAPAASGPSDVKAGVDAWENGDYAAAIRTWQPLADRGDPDAMFNLAQAYKMGRGVSLDLTRAEDLYGKAAAKGHIQAADAYGLMLFQRGERRRAVPYLEGSASRGDPRAQYILGVAHFNGDLVPRDWVRAYALASLARQAGLPQATSALEQMDRSIPLADRQKSVALAQKLSAEAQANRQRLSASAELGSRVPGNEVASPEVLEAKKAIAEATHASAAARPAPKDAAKAPVAPSTAKAAPKLAAQPAPSGPWRVQLGAFGVAGNADALWNKVKARPELAGHPRVLTPAGKLTKLQATGFASRTEAESACRQLSAGGFSCLPSRD